LISIDKKLTDKLLEGDEVVFETVFRNYYSSLCNYANTIIKDMDESEEIVQNTFLTLWEKRANISIHTSVKSYLYKSVYNSCLNKIKHYKVRNEYSSDYQKQNDIYIENTSHDLISKELEEQIELAIETMPPQCRTVFKLSRFENLSYAEIADQLDISVKTIENHITKALKMLRISLKEYLPTILYLFVINFIEKYFE